MILDNGIDLSLPTNQNLIAVSLATFFSIEELESIEFKKLRCPVKMGAIKSCGSMEYLKEFEDDNTFSVHCIIDTSIIPNSHFTLICMKSGDTYKSEFKCIPNNKNAEYLAITLKKAVNYEKFKNFEDRNYTRQNIMKNFSLKMVSDIGTDITIYKRLKDKLLEIEKEVDNLKQLTDDKIILSYDVDYVSIKILTIDKNIFKFEYNCTNTNKSDYCYFRRGYVGIDMLIMVFDMCISKIKSNFDTIDIEWIKNNLLGAS